jgi:hypothetical protein
MNDYDYDLSREMQVRLELEGMTEGVSRAIEYRTDDVCGCRTLRH